MKSPFKKVYTWICVLGLEYWHTIVHNVYSISSIYTVETNYSLFQQA